MAPRPSFELAGRLKASQQILAKELWVKSWMVWFWTLGYAATWVCIGIFAFTGPNGLFRIMHLIDDHDDLEWDHAGMFAVIVAFMSAVALHRSRACAGGDARLVPLPLHVIFPQGYSAFRLAKSQRPARVFIVITALLGLPGVGITMYLIVGTPNLPFVESVRVAFAFGLCATVLSSCGWYMLSGYFFCCALHCSSDAFADRALQERISSLAEEFTTQMGSKQIKPTAKEYIMLHLEMLLFAADFVSDGFAGWQFLQGEMYILFALQLGILLVSLWAETRQMRRRGDLSTWCRAFTESSRHGWPTDEFLAIVLTEKSVEVPLTFLLQNYAVWAVSFFAVTYGTSVLPMVFFCGKLALAVFGVAKAAYVLIHLDLARHLHAVQECRQALTRAAADRQGQGPPATATPMPAAPTAPALPVFPPGLELPPAMAHMQPTAPQCGAQDAPALPPGLGPPAPRPSMPPLPPLPPQPGFGGAVQVGKPRGHVDRE